MLDAISMILDELPTDVYMKMIGTSSIEQPVTSNQLPATRDQLPVTSDQ